MTHGLSRYRYGCKCDICRQAFRDWEQSRRTETCDGRPSCGTNSGYTHGCRDNACGVARLIWQRNKRGTKHPRPSKYDTPTPPEVINRWKELLGR